MIFIPVIGVEGCGHHLIEALLSGIDNVSINAANTELNRAWECGCTPESVSEAHDALRSIEASGATHHPCGTSFPYGSPRDALRRPDVRMLLDVPFPIRPIRMLRDPIECVGSATDRCITTDIKLQSAIVKENTIYIDYCMGLYYQHYDDTCVFPYWHFISDPGNACARLALLVRAGARQPFEALSSLGADLELKQHNDILTVLCYK